MQQAGSWSARLASAPCWARCATQCAELLLAPDHTSAAATLPRPTRRLHDFFVQQGWVVPGAAIGKQQQEQQQWGLSPG